MHGPFATSAETTTHLGLQGQAPQVNYGEAPDGFLSVNKKKKATFQVTTGHGNA